MTNNLSLAGFVDQAEFPCVMAKAVFSKGLAESHVLEGSSVTNLAHDAQKLLYKFVDKFQTHTEKLSSFALSFSDPHFLDFDSFESFFWLFLRELDALDKSQYGNDPRVKNDPASPKFSFSVKGEAFFMLVLHPESPRMARSYAVPTIIFNAHSQFEDLRVKGMFHKVRDLIRKRDSHLQGYINPMVEDFGKRSEVFQYMGKEYAQESKCPFLRFKNWFKG